MIYCGIDPGNTGAIAIFKKKKIIALYDMPTEIKLTGKGLQTSAPKLAKILKWWGIKKAFVERVHAMPGQGVTSMFTFGRGTGVIEGVSCTLGIDIIFVTPQAWKKEFILIKKEKDSCRIKAIKRFPKRKESLRLKKNIGRADSIFIGLYGYKMNLV